MAKPKTVTLSFEINAPLGPFERGEHFEDPLYDWLKERGVEILDGGGGTMLYADGNAVSDFFITFQGRSHLQGAIRFVKSLGVPVGSSYWVDDGEKTQCGDCERLQFSIKKPPRFGQKRIADLVAAVQDAVDDAGRMLTAYESKGRFVFGIYGKNVAVIKSSLATVAKNYSKHGPKCST